MEAAEGGRNRQLFFGRSRGPLVHTGSGFTQRVQRASSISADVPLRSSCPSPHRRRQCLHPRSPGVEETTLTGYLSRANGQSMTY